MEGMTYLDAFMNGSGLYTFKDGGSGGALDMYQSNGDISNYLDTFADITRTYLDNPANYDVNIVMWV